MGGCHGRKWDKSVLGSGSLSPEEQWSCGGPHGGVWMCQLCCVYGCPVCVIMTVWPHTRSHTHALHKIVLGLWAVFEQRDANYSVFRNGESVGLFPGGLPAAVTCVHLRYLMLISVGR